MGYKLTLDKTFREIAEAYKSGQNVRLMFDGRQIYNDIPEGVIVMGHVDLVGVSTSSSDKVQLVFEKATDGTVSAMIESVVFTSNNIMFSGGLDDYPSITTGSSSGGNQPK